MHSIASGTLTNPGIQFFETRKASSVSTKVEGVLLHGSGDAPAVNLYQLDPSNDNRPTLLARSLGFNEATRYLQFDPGFVSLQVTTTGNDEVAVFQLDLSGHQGEAVIVNLYPTWSPIWMYMQWMWVETRLRKISITGVEDSGGDSDGVCASRELPEPVQSVDADPV